MTKSLVYEKSKLFALRIVKLYCYLTEEKREFVMSKQLLRSGTSIGANLAEAVCAVSRPDFLSKAYVAYKESSETCYWLDLLHEAQYLADTQYESASSDARELFRMLTSITKTTRTNPSPLAASSKFLTSNC